MHAGADSDGPVTLDCSSAGRHFRLVSGRLTICGLGLVNGSTPSTTGGANSRCVLVRGESSHSCFFACVSARDGDGVHLAQGVSARFTDSTFDSWECKNQRVELNV